MQVKKQQLEPDLNNLLDQNWERNTSRLYTVILLFKLYAEYIIRNARLDEAQARIKNVQRNINSLRYADDTNHMTESEELKGLLMKMKEESEKVGLKVNIQKTKIMASGPITSWLYMGKQWKSDRLYFLGPQNHCRW